MPVILRQLISWVLEPKVVFAVALCFLAIFSALGVSYSSHQTRNMYSELQQLEKNQDDLEHEYEKLLLEQSAWADYTRLNQLAREELEMTPPSNDELVVIR